ncbi:MAG: hypothetical protein GX303_05340 [Clostridiales bacterium]|nr:hypothetical protein [Clostridiales bacterium]
MKKSLLFLIAATLLFSLLSVNTFAATVWDGTEDTSWFNTAQTEFTISTPQELAGLSKLAAGGEIFDGKTIKLGADIVMNAGSADTWKTTPPTNKWVPIANFMGTFDGQNHTISGLYNSSLTSNNIALFARVTGGTIKNVAIVNSFFAGNNTVASVVAEITTLPGTVENVYSDAIVNGMDGTAGDPGFHVGGIIGKLNPGAENSEIKGCWFDGTVDGKSKYVGGILGNGNSISVTIRDCLNTGAISASDEAGGIIGRQGGNGTSITNCVNAGSITTNATGTSLADIVGMYKVGGTGFKMTIEKCYFDNATPTKKTHNSYDANAVIEGSGATGLATAKMKGEAAKTNMTDLDFTNKWATVADGYAVPKGLLYMTASGESPVVTDPPANTTSTGGGTTTTPPTGDVVFGVIILTLAALASVAIFKKRRA